MDPTIRTFKFVFTDDYRQGPSLSCEEIFDDNTDDIDDYEDYTFMKFTIPDDRYHVFILDLGKQTQRLLKSFPTWDDAELYAKQQYTLVTGDFPFITTGMNIAYHPKGGRPEVPLKNIDRDIAVDEEDNGFIIIIHGSEVSTYSLNPYAVW